MTIAAFFDMDRTILNDSSGMLLVRYLRETGRIGPREGIRIAWWFLWYTLGLIEFPQAMMRMLMMSSGEEEEPLQEETDAWFEEWVVPHITRDAIQRIEEHRAQGHRPVVISAATVYVVKPLAERLNVPDYLCTYLEVKNGRFTGRLIDPVPYGRGKALVAEQFAERHGIDLEQSYFYSDGKEDIPFLERVGHPVAVNPHRRLRRLAEQRGWPIESWP
ncbi:MAG TPA: HAD family hydrolase [Anaerolineae bacterium]|jgi:putative phosphoserine phosphatase/1-acylglycerol-3-phosphate O-acyltransferase|nr:HAD family hydrolase [Anaerolineae bacterium]